MPRRPTTRLATVLLATSALAACNAPSLPIVYRPDLQQGNVITQEMIDQLEPGMNKRKVRFVLGTPLVADTFNPDRWDYYYSFADRGRDRTQRRVTLYFENDALVTVEGDVEVALGTREAAPTPERVVIVPERREPGIIAALTPTFLKRDKREDALERSGLEVEGERTGTSAGTESSEQAPGAAPPEEVAAAAPGTEVAPAGISAEQTSAESQYFQRLFQGYGRPQSDSAITGLEAPQQEQPATDGESPPPTGSEPGQDGQVAGAEDAAPEATEEEKGFFSNLVDRMRRQREGGEDEQDAATPEPADESPGELPGEED